MLEENGEAKTETPNRMAAGSGNGLCVGHGRPGYNHFCFCRHLVHRPRIINFNTQIQTSPVCDQKPCFFNRNFQLLMDVVQIRMYAGSLQMLANTGKVS